MRRLRKAKWIRQDERIASALTRLERGERTLMEFLLEAQNATKGLQLHQVHVATSSDIEDPESYPAALPVLDDDPEDGEN